MFGFGMRQGQARCVQIREGDEMQELFFPAFDAGN
jgi:hypothetical protein